MEKKKEKSGRQRMRVDSGREVGDERGTLLLANPMAGGEVAASLPPTGAPEQPQPRVPLAGARKTRPKSPSLLRFFVRGGVGRKGSEEEEGVDSAGSDHDDPFSSCTRLSHSSMSESLSSVPESPIRHHRGVESAITVPRRRRRVGKRDSGFQSEWSESTSQDKEQLSSSPDDLRPVREVCHERAMGMEALEALHNHIQILVKQDCPEEETQVTSLHNAVIASLRQQLEDTNQSLDILHISDQQLRLALRETELRLLESEARRLKDSERIQCLEHKLLTVVGKYREVQRTAKEGTTAVPHHSLLPGRLGAKAMYYSPQVQRSRRSSDHDVLSSLRAARRPSSAHDPRNRAAKIETCV